MIQKEFQCNRCGGKWKIHWNSKKDKIPKACKFCKSTIWNRKRGPIGKDLVDFLMKVEFNGHNNGNKNGNKSNHKEGKWQRKNQLGIFI